MEKLQYIEFLKKYPLFSGCKEETMEALAENAANFEVVKGDCIDLTNPEQVAFILHGTMKIVGNPGKKQKTLFLMKEGDAIGMNSLVNHNTESYSVFALSNGELIFWEADFMKNVLLSDSNLMLSVIKYLGKKTNRINDRISVLSSPDVKDRLLFAISEFKNEFGLDDDGSLNLKLSMNEWSDYISAGVPEVYKAFDQLEEKKLVNFE